METYKNRAEVFIKYVKGSVLDIGCTGRTEYGFIHKELSKKADKLIGIDINEEGIKQLNKQGFNAILQDAQEPYNLNQKFDVIVSGENIEHISNLKTYLENIHRHLKEDGILLLTTPNAVSSHYIINTFVFGRPRASVYHTHCHSIDTIKYLLTKYKFKIKELKVICLIDWKAINLKEKLFELSKMLFPKVFGKTIFIVVKKDFKVKKK